MPDRETVTIDWPGPVIVGGGAVGILSALLLAQSGENVLLIERDGLAGGQTASCHGWIHRGNIYENASPAETEALAEGAAWWREHATRASHAAEVSFSSIAEADQAAAAWERLGLIGHQVTSSWLLPQRAVTLATDEFAISPNAVLRDAWEHAQVRPTVLIGTVVSISPSVAREDVGTVEIDLVHRRLRVSSSHVIVAAGNSSGRLLRSSGYQSRQRIRHGFMLVIEADGLPTAPLCLRGPDSRGLFGCVRELENRSPALLVSDYVSYRGEGNTQLVMRSWLRGVMTTIRKELPEVWGAVDSYWGVYRAPKVDTLTSSDIPSLASRDFGPSVLAVVPGKLTLAPVLARRSLAGRRTALEARNLGDIEDSRSEIWRDETWTYTPRRTRKSLWDAVNGRTYRQ